MFNSYLWGLDLRKLLYQANTLGTKNEPLKFRVAQLRLIQNVVFLKKSLENTDDRG